MIAQPTIIAAMLSLRSMSKGGLGASARAFLSARAAPHVGADGFVSKVYATPEEALHDFTDGVKVLVGGFGLAGVPEVLVKCVQQKGVRGLSVVSNEVGTPDYGVGLWVGQMRRVALSYVGSNRVVEKQFLDGDIELELTPQGTLAERIRAGGAGIPAFYTPAGHGTWHHTGGIPIRIPKKLAEGKSADAGIVSAPRESRDFNGKGYVLEEAITGDFALIKAWKGDTEGNLMFHAAARNFNPDMGKAARVCVAEVEHLLPAGQLTPDEIHLPGIYVDRVVQVAPYQTPIEKRTLRGVKAASESSEADDPNKIRIARRAACELRDGMYVNLGIGIPTLVPNYVHSDMRVTLHSENGILGVGAFPLPGQEEAELINAGKQTVSYNPGASIVSSSESFALIRGQHIELTMLGGLEVSQFGDLANWIVPGKMVKGMGGAMDLVSSGNKVVVVMIHNTPSGGIKIKPDCDLPLTGRRVVSTIITELAVFNVNPVSGLTLVEIAPNVTVNQLRERTTAPFAVSPDLREMMQ